MGTGAGGQTPAARRVPQALYHSPGEERRDFEKRGHFCINFTAEGQKREKAPGKVPAAAGPGRRLIRQIA